MNLIDDLYHVKPWKLTVTTIAIFILVSIGFWGLFYHDILVLTLAIPLLIAVILSIIGGATTGGFCAVIMAMMAFYFIPDINRLAQSVISNVIMVVMVGGLSSWARFSYLESQRNKEKVSLVDHANGWVNKLEEAYLIAKEAESKYHSSDGQTKIALIAIRENLSYLMTMVRGFRVLYKEKKYVLQDAGEKDSE